MSKTEFKKISLQELAIGVPTLWDIYDANEKLLARKGFVPQSERQLEALINRGLFANAEDYRKSRSSEVAEDSNKKPQHHVLNMLEQARNIIHSVTIGVIAQTPLPDTPLEIMKAVRFLDEAYTINPDIACAAMLFKQTSEGYANRHLIDAATLSLAVAKTMNKSAEETALITAAALTMNVSILQLQEDLQNRETAATEDELEQIRRHPAASVQLLKEAGVTDTNWLGFVHDHHENMDGSGYPAGKSGDTLSDGAKIIALADRYTEMIAPRKNSQAMHPTRALRSMLIDGGKISDAMISAYFIKELGIYPPGASVKLINGETGIVMRKGFSAMAPAVLVIKNQYGVFLPFPQKRDTAIDRFAIKEPVHLEANDIPFTMQHLWGSEAT